MDLQFFGANCLIITTKNTRIVIDDNLVELASKSITKAGDVVLFTGEHTPPKVEPKLLIDEPGEYELSGVVINGIKARSHIDGANQMSATVYMITYDDISVVVTGHIHPDIGNGLVELIGGADVLCLPVGGHGYTLDGEGALQVIKLIEPKIVIPTHYADKDLKFSVPQQSLAEAIQALAMEPKETVAKLRLKLGELSDVTQLVVLEKS